MWQFTNKNAITIPDNADMKSSTYLAPGVYKCDTDIGSKTLKNCPTSGAFTLFVYKTLAIHAKYITQEFRTIKNEVYKRHFNGYQDGMGWYYDAKTIISTGLGSSSPTIIDSGTGVYFQVGTDNDYTKFVINNRWVVIEHFTNGTKDKTISLWDGK